MTGAPIGIGIAGLGRIARSHAEGYRRLAGQAEIRGVCDLDAEKARAFAEEFGGTPHVDIRALIADPSIDAVDLILPHTVHFQAASAVLAAGKHLLLEKPIAATYGEAEVLCQKAAEAGVHFTVAENTRYVAAYMSAARLLEEGAIGKVNRVRTFLSSNEKARLTSPSFWGRDYSTGGGLILDTGAH